jgi:hypothetical protein
LIYLAGQIRQNSRLLQASTASVTQQSVTAQQTLTIQDPEMARIYWQGMADRADLSGEDRQRFDPLVGMHMAHTQLQLRLVRDGILNPGIWTDMQPGVRWRAQQPGFQQWWDQWAKNYSGDFRAYIGGLIREGEAAE